MNEEYTLATEEVRNIYVNLLAHSSGNLGHSYYGDSFDRWFTPYREAMEIVQRVRELHCESPIPYDDMNTMCEHCGYVWPCATLRALDGVVTP